MKEADMDENIDSVRHVFHEAHHVKVGGSKGEIWILKDHLIPTEVLGRGRTPCEAWINACRTLGLKFKGEPTR